MRRFKNILAVYDDSIGTDDVFCQATALARENAARLTFINVLQDSYATRAGIEERRKRLARLKPAVAAEGVREASFIVSAGIPFLNIIQQVLRADHDLVIASAHAESTLRNAYFGSTATHLMRKCPCPVWVVKPGQSAEYERILACIDPQPMASDASRMDRTILDLATSLAVANFADLHIVHAWEVTGKDRDTLASELHDDSRAAILAEHEAVHRERVQALLSAYPLAMIDHHLHLPRDTPHEAIISLVDRHRIDLIVMGTVSRTGLPGLIIGNAAEKILSAVQCSVMTIKPEAFNSPVVLEDIRKIA